MGVSGVTSRKISVAAVGADTYGLEAQREPARCVSGPPCLQGQIWLYILENMKRMLVDAGIDEFMFASGMLQAVQVIINPLAIY